VLAYSISQFDTHSAETKMSGRTKQQLPIAIVVVGLLVSVPGSSVTFAQEESKPTTRQFDPASDHFVGVWKLNEDKSTTKGVRELITIEPQGGETKFTYDWAADNGTELQWWFVTDMKGGPVKPEQTNGKPMSKDFQPRVTRIDSNRFVDDGKLFRDEYTVSADGKTLTILRTYKIDPSPHKLPAKTVLVFERQK